MFMYFQPLYLQQFGANPLTIGAILGGVGIAMTAAQIPAGYLSDRFGRRPMMWFSWILGVLAAWIMALASSLTVFVIGILAYGLTSSVLAPMNSYISEARGKWSVGRALTVVSAVYNLGAVLGPLIGGFLGERYQLKTVYFVAACIFGVSTLLILFIRPQAVQRHPDGKARPSLLSNPRFTGLLALVFLTCFAIYLPQPLTPNFLQNQRQLSVQAIGQVGAVGSLGNALLMLALGQLNSTLAFMLGQVAVGLFALLLWQGQGMAWYAIGYFFIGGYRLARTMTLALVRPLVHQAEIGLAYGLVETVNALTIILAPPFAGLLYNTQPSLMFPFSIGLILLALLANGFFLRKLETQNA